MDEMTGSQLSTCIYRQCCLPGGIDRGRLQEGAGLISSSLQLARSFLDVHLNGKVGKDFS